MGTSQPTTKCFGKSSDTPDAATCGRCRKTLLGAHGIDRTAETGICQEQCAAEQLSKESEAHFQRFLHGKLVASEQKS